VLLGVWAHPDDEAYLSAGLMLAARRAGCRVVVLTMTAGEIGTQHPDRWPPDRLGELRRHELRASLAALDVTEHHVVGLPDGRCDRYDATELIASAIRAVRPTTIVTFGPDGFTGHPDHKAVSHWCTAAWHATGRTARLWYATVAPSFHHDHGHLNAEVDLWSMHDGPPPCDAPESVVHEVRLRGTDLDRKIAALRAHASQTTAMIATVGEDAYWAWWSTEWFRAAPVELMVPMVPMVPATHQPVADLRPAEGPALAMS
jgi:LmbE family N-acetylglucosaminyl deacetylase